MATRSVGRVSVKVSPDTSKFAADLKADLERLEHSLNVEVPAALDASELQRDARVAAAQADRILGSIPDAQIGADTTGVTLAVDRLRAQLATLPDPTINIDADTTTAQVHLAAFAAELAAVTGDRHVNVDVDTAGGRTAIRGLVSDADTAATSIAGKFATMAAGVSNNVYVMAAVVVAALAALPVAGGLAATGIVLAFGAGLAGLGIAAAAQSKKVRNAFSGLKDHVVGELKQMAKPFEPVLVQIAGTFRRTFDSLSPAISGAFDTIAPALGRFATNVGTALSNLGPAIKPIAQAFSDLLDVLGPMLPGLFQQISDAFTQLAGTISAHPDLFAGMIAGLIKLMPIALQFINWLANVFVWISQHPRLVQFAAGFVSIAVAIGELLPLITQLPGKIAALVNNIVTFISGLPGKAAKALASLGSTLGGIASQAWNRVKSLTTTGVNAVVNFIRGLPGKARSAISSLTSAIGNVASRAWNSVRTKTTAGINAVIGFVRGLPGKARSAANALVGNLRSVASNAFNSMRSAASSGISRVVGLARGIPGRIRSAVGSLGSVLYGAGQNVIRGLINGIRSMISSVGSTMSNIASTIRSYLPFSPAKKGPLRSHPPETSGRRIIELLAGGLTHGNTLDAAMRQVAGAMVDPGVPSLAGASGVGRTGAAVNIEQYIEGGKSVRAISEDLMLLMGARG